VLDRKFFDFRCNDFTLHWHTSRRINYYC
jgi:hypothetical protein